MASQEEQQSKEKSPGEKKIAGGIIIILTALILAGVLLRSGWFLSLLALGGGLWLGIWLIKEGGWDVKRANDEKRLQQEAKPFVLNAVPTAPEETSTPEVAEPDGAPTSTAPEEEQTRFTSFVNGTTLLGWLAGNGEIAIPTRDRYAGMYVIGVQGVGKSSFLESLILHNEIYSDQAVIVIDPHGDLIDHCMANMPERRLQDAYLLDIEDVDYPFGLNLFAIRPGASVTEQSGNLDRILHVFEKCFPDTSRMLLEKYLGNIAPVFFANEGAGYSMTDIPKFLRDDTFRAKLMRAGKIRYAIREFWEEEYGQLSPSRRQSETASLATRLNRFVRSPIVGGIIGQSSTTIDFRDAIEKRRIIFIKLPVKTLREDAQLIGTMLVAQIHAAIFSFADLPAEQRPGFSLFVDEFQHFATSDFSEMFTEGRKFGSRVTVAHQYRDQLPDYLKSATMTARTKVCFQTTVEDSRELAHLYLNIIKPKPDRDSLDPDPIGYLLEHGSDNPRMQRMIDKYFRPIAEVARAPLPPGGPVKSYEADVERKVRAALHNRKEQAKSAIETFNRVIFEAEATENWQQLTTKTIETCLEIFDRFYKGKELEDFMGEPSSPIYEYFRNLQGSGLAAFADPSNFISQEAISALRERLIKAHWSKFRAYGFLPTLDAFLNFMVDIRWFLAELVAHPIGNIRPISTAEIASMIVNLPRRHAYVRSGSQVFHMSTYTSDKINASVLAERKKAIREQTRATYCRPAGEVDEEVSKRLGLSAGKSAPASEQDGAREASETDKPDTQEPEPSRWEEI
jgi:hypothetical protein